jgi:hypothetical protein
MPRLFYVVLVLFCIFIRSNIALAARSVDKVQYATSFFSLSEPEQVEALNRKLSEILQTYPAIEVLGVRYLPVTSKGKKYFRSIVVTGREGLFALKNEEHEIAKQLRQHSQKLYGLAIRIERWAYRLPPPSPITKPPPLPLDCYDKVNIAGTEAAEKRVVILIDKFARLSEAREFCEKLGSKGVEVILGYPRKRTIGEGGRKIDPVPFRLFLKSFEDTDLVFESVRQAQEYLRKNESHLYEKIGTGSWQIYDARYSWELVPRKKHNLLLGSFRLDRLPSMEKQLKSYLGALEEREIPVYLTTVTAREHSYLRVVHVVPDESQLQINLALERLAEELNDFSVELGKAFHIHPEKIPKDDPLEGAKFTLDDLFLTISNGRPTFPKEGTVGNGQKESDAENGKARPLSLSSQANRLPVNVRDLFGKLFLPRIWSLQDDLKRNNMIGLKVVKTFLPGKGECTCFAIERHHQEKHLPVAEQLKATGKIFAFFVYQQDKTADLNQLAQLAVRSEIKRRQTEAMNIARLEKQEAAQRLAQQTSEETARRLTLKEIQNVIENFGYSKHIHPVILHQNTLGSFRLIDEIMDSIDLTDYPDLSYKMKALMWAESAGNPRAMSCKNARGPLQVTLKGYMHIRRKFSELIRMAEKAEMMEKNGLLFQARQVFPHASRRLLENAWRLVDPHASSEQIARDPKLNICEGTLQFLIDYVFFTQRYVEAKPQGKDYTHYSYELRRKESNHDRGHNLFDPEIAAMASYNYGRYGVIKAIKRKGTDFVQTLPRETRQHLANYFITKLSLDQEFLEEYKKVTKHDIPVESPREPYRFRGKIRKIAQKAPDG